MREDQIKAADFAVRFESLEAAVFIRTDGNSVVSLASGKLVRALQNGFAGVENETAIALREHTKHDWTITQTTCDIYFDHSNMDRTTVPPEVVTKKVARAIGCLRRKVVRLPDI